MDLVLVEMETEFKTNKRKCVRSKGVENYVLMKKGNSKKSCSSEASQWYDIGFKKKKLLQERKKKRKNEKKKERRGMENI